MSCTVPRSAHHAVRSALASGGAPLLLGRGLAPRQAPRADTARCAPARSQVHCPKNPRRMLAGAREGGARARALRSLSSGATRCHNATARRRVQHPVDARRSTRYFADAH